jgi:hypothetical protein
MTNQRDPELKRPGDYIDQNTSAGWAPLILGLVFVGLLGFLMFGPSPAPSSDRPAISQTSELPNTASSTPLIPTPAPPKPK